MERTVTINELIDIRLRQCRGMSKLQIARKIGTSPNQVNLFLSGKASLTVEGLNTILKLDTLLDDELRRLGYLINIAELAMIKQIKPVEILKFSKKEFSEKINNQGILDFIEPITRESYLRLIKNGIISIENTFPWIREFISYYMLLIENNYNSQKAFKELCEIHEKTYNPPKGDLGNKPIQCGIENLFSRNLEDEYSLLWLSLL